MARQVRDTNISTRNARRILKIRPKPYWRALDKGIHLGYRRRPTGGSWIARRFSEAGTYIEKMIGIADDFADADKITIFDFAQAQAEARAWANGEMRRAAGLEEPQTGPYTVKNAIDDYKAHYKAEGKSEKSTSAAIEAHIIPSLGEIEVAKLTTKKITDWHRGLASAPARLRTSAAAATNNIRLLDLEDNEALRPRRATANRILTILKAALNHAWKDGKVTSDNAWRKVKPFRNVDMPVIRYLTQAECVRLINTCPSDLKEIVQGALFTGCRYGELGNLKVSDFDPDAGTVAIRVSKSGKPRHVILTTEAQEFFSNAVRNKGGDALIFTRGKAAWGKSHQSRPLLQACQRAKITPAISFHILRHTHGSFLAAKGVPMTVIAQQLGHADTRMTEKHYAHLAPSYVADTIRANFPSLGIVEKTNIEDIPSKQSRTGI